MIYVSKVIHIRKKYIIHSSYTQSAWANPDRHCWGSGIRSLRVNRDFQIFTTFPKKKKNMCQNNIIKVQECCPKKDTRVVDGQQCWNVFGVASANDLPSLLLIIFIYFVINRLHSVSVTRLTWAPCEILFQFNEKLKTLRCLTQAGTGAQDQTTDATRPWGTNNMTY